MTDNLQTAALAGGCFWCMEAVFERLNGIYGVISGYAGGSVKNPAYEQVSRGNTGHAETIQITFDPNVITYRQILEIFFAVHDPTTPNQQGNDIGSQYRSVIFYYNEDQKLIAKKLIKELDSSNAFDSPIVTEVLPLEEFYKAESYHQNYFENNSNESYCQAVINPKLKKLRDNFQKFLK